MQYFDTWSMPILAFDLDFDLEQAQSLIDQNEFEHSNFDTGSWSNEQQILKHPIFETAVQQIKTACNTFAIDQNHRAEDIKIISSWANILQPGRGINMHWHDNSYISGAIHFDADSTFVVRAPYTKDWYGLDIEAIGDTPVYELECKPKQCIIFPSKMLHGVLSTKNKRYSMAFNTWPSKFGEKTMHFDMERML